MDDSNTGDQNPRVKAEIRQVIERQLQAPTLPEVSRAVERLTSAGHSREDAIDAVGAILLDEISDVLTEKEPFDEARYIERLERLQE